jgi:hypothetical protein
MYTSCVWDISMIRCFYHKAETVNILIKILQFLIVNSTAYPILSTIQHSVTVSLTLILLMWRKGWAPNSIPIYIQQDAKLHSLFISGNCSIRFGWYFHPTSGVHTTTSTASGICHTVTAICRYRGRFGTRLSVLWLAYVTVVCAPDDGWKYHPKHVEQFPDINKLCNVASCCIYTYIGIYLRCTDP